MKSKFSVMAIFIAIAFWFFDASIHYFAYGEPQLEFIPSDINELWMRIVIILLIIFFGIFADHSAEKLLIREKRLEAARIYGSMIRATQHILNNLMNQMMIIRMEALESKDFDRSVIKLFDNAINEASQLIKKLSHIENITEENIWASIEPGNTVDSFISSNIDETNNHRTD